ncbi:MAG: hypothetical protein CML56_08550 [Rhodobacteraceae bacterium]|nr:hypothetical protein [Paracoccaceae bacterium]
MKIVKYFPTIQSPPILIASLLIALFIWYHVKKQEEYEKNTPENYNILVEDGVDVYNNNIKEDTNVSGNCESK